jgi:hypothetical protein
MSCSEEQRKDWLLEVIGEDKAGGDRSAKYARHN